MTETLAGIARLPSILDIIDNIADFVTRHEQSAAACGASCALTAGRVDVVARGSCHAELPSLFDDVLPARAASAYSRSAAAKRAERVRKAVSLLAILCI